MSSSGNRSRITGTSYFTGNPSIKKKSIAASIIIVICMVIAILPGPAIADLGATPWPMFGHDPQHTGRSPYLGPQTNTVKWSYATGGPILYSSPAIGSDGTIYIGSGDHNLYAINPDGTLNWSYPTGGKIYSSPAIDSDGTVYVGSMDSKLYAINPGGTLKWSYATGAPISYSSPAIGVDGTIYFGSSDKKLYAINPTGTLKWSYTTGGIVNSSPAIGVDGTIYFGSSSGNLFAINPDGTWKWTFGTNGNVSFAPAISNDGTIYVGSGDYKFYAINPTGTLKWYYATGGGETSPAIANDGSVYVSSYDGKLYAFDSNGSLKWSYAVGSVGNASSAPSIASDGTVYVGSGGGDSNLYAFNPNGTLKWSCVAGNYVAPVPAIGSDGTLYVGTGDGKLYAFGLLPLSISAATPTTAQIGTPYTLTPTVSGGTGAPYTWSTINKPFWLLLNANTGVMSGTPGVSAATVTFTLQVKDKNGTQASKDLTIVVNPAPPAAVPTITAATPTTATIGTAYTLAPTASGGAGAPYTWSTINKPFWLMLNAGTGVMSGTPGVSAATVTFTLQVKDKNGTQASKDLTIVVNPVLPAAVPVITADTPTTATKGTPYTLTPTVSGGSGAPYTWSTVNKPFWLLLNANTGVLSGTPGVSATTVTFTLKVKDNIGTQATKDLTIIMNP